MAQAGLLPIPLVCLPGADHNLNRREKDIAAIIAQVASSPAAKRWLDPAARRRASSARKKILSAGDLISGPMHPPPARLDVEVTTRCQLRCALCARTLTNEAMIPQDMAPALFERVLDQAEFAQELIFVGLGEPLLHPELERLVSLAAQRGLRLKVVTNGLAATPDTLDRLHDAGLHEITFSIDSTHVNRFAALRGGASLETVLHHFNNVPARLQKSIFATLSQTNAADLGPLSELARANGLPVIAVSDVNFAQNSDTALHHGNANELLEAGLRHARATGILVIGPHLHEVADPTKDFRHCLVRSAAELSARSNRHTHCLAPWRIAVIGVTGNVTPCNCAPERPVGSLMDHSLHTLWTNPTMTTWRTNVTTGSNPHCRTCPRW